MRTAFSFCPNPILVNAEINCPKHDFTKTDRGPAGHLNYIHYSG